MVNETLFLLYAVLCIFYCSLTECCTKLLFLQLHEIFELLMVALSYLLSTGPQLPPPRVWGRASGFAGGQFMAMRSGDLLGLKNIIRITGVVSNENSKTCLIWTTQLCAVAMLDHEQARRIHDFLNCGCLTCTGKLYIKIALAPAAHAIGYELPSRLKRCSLK